MAERPWNQEQEDADGGVEFVLLSLALSYVLGAIVGICIGLPASFPWCGICLIGFAAFWAPRLAWRRFRRMRQRQ